MKTQNRFKPKAHPMLLLSILTITFLCITSHYAMAQNPPGGVRSNVSIQTPSIGTVFKSVTDLNPRAKEIGGWVCNRRVPKSGCTVTYYSVGTRYFFAKGLTLERSSNGKIQSRKLVDVKFIDAPSAQIFDLGCWLKETELKVAFINQKMRLIQGIAMIGDNTKVVSGDSRNAKCSVP